MVGWGDRLERGCTVSWVVVASTIYTEARKKDGSFARGTGAINTEAGLGREASRSIFSCGEWTLDSPTFLYSRGLLLWLRPAPAALWPPTLPVPPVCHCWPRLWLLKLRRLYYSTCQTAGKAPARRCCQKKQPQQSPGAWRVSEHQRNTRESRISAHTCQRWDSSRRWQWYGHRHSQDSHLPNHVAIDQEPIKCNARISLRSSIWCRFVLSAAVERVTVY